MAKLKIFDVKTIVIWKKEKLLKELKILNLQANALRARELKKLNKSNLPTPQAYSEQYGANSYRTISFKGNKTMGINELRHRYLIVSNFLNTKTKNIDDFKEFLHSFAEKYQLNYDILSNKMLSERLWKAVNKLVEMNYDVKAGSVTNLIQYVDREMSAEITSDSIFTGNVDDIITKIMKATDSEYEKNKIEEAKITGEYFDFGRKDT